ncbi:MAG: hypothetical protein LAT82_01060 [Nanoarchaeota archaeon]|nr:hypothetical protein [Nanoarchaeota archaeon]
MDIGLILYFIIIIVLIILVFKMIKKIIFAIITSVIIVLLSLVAIAGLVYLDVQDLTQTENATINVVYMLNDEFHTGITFPFSAEEELEISEVNTLSSQEFESNLNSNEEIFTILVHSNVFDIIENRTISINELLGDESISMMTSDDIGLPVSSIRVVLDSPNPKEELTSILLESLDLGEELEEMARPLLESALDEIELEQGLDLHSISFGLLLNELVQDDRNLIDVFIEFQNENIEVLPSRISFTLLKYIPVGIVKNFIDGNE